VEPKKGSVNMAHECKVESVKAEMGNGYQAQCSCGYKGTVHFYPIARSEAEEHLRKVSGG